ncbi:MAG: DNA repair exonuclease [Candidatus Aenigmatarchaeota archaeon]|nr:MAG: DNA repair exonuclease [Candidatus Aenigmarchaeota archaeon]
MRIAFISDTHFGFGRSTERSEDAWDTFEEAVARIEELECDLIVHAGDMFDTKLPRPEEWSRALRTLARLKTPLAVIHGNHERRGKGLTNPVEGLAQGGHFDYINANHKLYEFGGARVAVHGIGWVPEAYARDVLQHWNPKPVEGAFNILVMHQSIHPFIFNPIEPPSIRLEDLPAGFDLYVDGHIHEHQVTTAHGKPFMIVGSTVTTQVNKAEASGGKSFVVVEVDGAKTNIQTVPLLSARRVFYKEIEINDRPPQETKKLVEAYVEDVLKQRFDRKPLIRVRVKGRLPKGVSFSDTNLKDLRDAYAEKCILSIGSRLSEESFGRHVLQEIREQRLSLDELGFKLLREFLKQQKSGFRFEDVFEHLVEGDAEATLVTLLAEKREQMERPMGVPA